ncbi:hypothetical protein ATANTOWER_004671 [Ataeniobius toweri]|uniref:Secreted protein n=1 Tax=Ataeniobius toweri TaxID=208326 RepID=A0ABU7B597_9TELE|nr:hypothetical protein [Ataeniobius toweri]
MKFVLLVFLYYLFVFPIHSLYPLLPYRVAGKLSPAVYGRDAGYTLGRSPVHHRATQDKQPCTHSFTPKGILERPIILTVMSLDYGRKLEYPERTHACMGRTCKLHAERPQTGLEPRTFSLQDNRATNCTTMQP